MANTGAACADTKQKGLGRYDPLVIEPEIFDFWKKKKIYEKAKKKVNKGKPFYYLDGPPYTSGKVHIGTAWNKSLKDCIQRYKRMRGFNVWDRAGYDMHGLPTEHATEKKLGIKGKQGIEKLGVAKFVEACEKLCVENMLIMNEDFKRMGVWMDFDNAYQSIKPEFTEGVWWLIKQAHKKGRLYEGKRTMTWCAHCATALAKHELEYENVNEKSIFMKFPVEGEENTFLLIWTTTPWTIPHNLCIMAGPELDYVKVEVEDAAGKSKKQKNEKWILAKALAGPVILNVAEKKFKILEEFKGEKLKGMKYLHPLHKDIPFFDEIKDNPKLHTVVLSSEYVDTSAGTGLVHCAPGGGPEDYEVGRKNGLPPFNSLDEHGVFHGVGRFSNKVAKKDDAEFIDIIDESGTLLAATMVEHDYPHCQRCHKPVIFRATTQWFFKVEDMKQKLIKENNKIKWVPDAAYNAFNSWLENLRDNSITKQRYWGTPIPVWKCDKCDHYIVLSTIKEIEKHGKCKLKNLHKPWIDEVKFPCEQPKCKGTKKRLPDILDVWIDAGSASWNCLDYPHKKDLFKKLFPADFILEGKDQIRGWFNLLHVGSMLGMGKLSFKECYMHGFVQDAKGRKMSKSLGNYILPQEVIDKYGADTLRYYTTGGANPAVDLNYNFDDMKLKYRNLGILWNVHKFILDYAKTLGKNPAKSSEKKMAKSLALAEQYMLSRTQSTIKEVTRLYDNYLLDSPPPVVEKLFLDLSRTYMQLVREKSALGKPAEKEAVLYTLYTSFLAILKLFAPTAPFITEKMYLNFKDAFKDAFGLKEESIHHCAWPKPIAKHINKKLEHDVGCMENVIQSILACREKAKLGVRWPIKEVVVTTQNKEVKAALKKLQKLIMVQTNVKKLTMKAKLAGVTEKVKPDFKKLKPEFKEQVPEIIAKLTIDSPETILTHLKKEGKHKVMTQSGPVFITEQHLTIEKCAPEQYIPGSFKGGEVYLDTTRTSALDTEGYARELMRSVQSLRKKKGLEKTDRISLHITTEKAMVSALRAWKKQIMEKVGAKTLTMSDTKKGSGETETFKVKGKSFVISFEKL